MRPGLQRTFADKTLKFIHSPDYYTRQLFTLGDI